MINKVVLVGRVTKDLELKKTNSQSPVAYVNFTLAVNRSFSNSNGERESDFIRCVAWRLTAENLVKFNGKGSLIGVEGRIQTSSKEINGKREFFVEVNAESVAFLDSKDKGKQPNEAAYQPQQGYQPQPEYPQQGYQQPEYQQNQYQQPQYQQGNYQQSYGSYSNNQPQQGGYPPTGMQQSQSYQTPVYVDDDLPF